MIEATHMTFEELNRVVEFIVERQARLSATLDRAEERYRQDHEGSKGMIKQLAVSNQRVVKLIAGRDRIQGSGSAAKPCGPGKWEKRANWEWRSDDAHGPSCQPLDP